MLAASTPVPKRKRKNPSSELDGLALSPIGKHEAGAKRRSMAPLPEVPVGTTIEFVRASLPRSSRRPSDFGGVNANLPPLSSLPRRLSRISTKTKSQKEVCPPPPPPREEPNPLPPAALRATSSRASSAGLNSIISKAARNSKKPHSIYPELVVITDSEDESLQAERIHYTTRTRRSVASRRKACRGDKVTEPTPAKSDVPGVSEFLRSSSRVDESKGPPQNRSTIRLQAGRSMRLTAVREDRIQSLFVERSEYLAFEATALKNENHYFDPEEDRGPSCPKITKFTLSDVESWKGVKDQPGCYFSRGLPALSAGVDGEPFPARCGYLKLSPNTKMDIASCPNNIVFTVIKGKGHMKDKTNGATEKTEMNIGDTFIVPKGSAFTFINMGRKNEFILAYVKHN